MNTNTQEETSSAPVEQQDSEWLIAIKSEAEKKAAELADIFKAKVKTFVFVIEEGKDAAVGFMRVPDAIQGFKLIRNTVNTTFEYGVQNIAKAQLIRTGDLNARSLEGEASDARFMDAAGNYDPEHSSINLSLLMQASKLIEVYSDQFKKK